MIRLTNARLVDPEAGTETLGWCAIEGNQISALGEGDAPGDGHDLGGKYLAPGIVDIGVKVSEPGERHKESFRSAGRAAAAGGVTTMVIRPDTMPAIDEAEAALVRKLSADGLRGRLSCATPLDNRFIEARDRDDAYVDIGIPRRGVWRGEALIVKPVIERVGVARTVATVVVGGGREARERALHSGRPC